MTTRGVHLIAEYHGCAPARLNHLGHVRRVLQRAADSAGATVLSIESHRFEPQGVAGLALLAESHLSLHTWPERGYAAADFYTCGDALPRRAHEVMRRELRASGAEIVEMARGLPGAASLSILKQERVRYDEPPTAIRFDLRDLSSRGLRLTRDDGGAVVGLFTTRDFEAGEGVLCMEAALHPLDVDVTLDTDAGACSVGLDWSCLDVSAKWLQRVSIALRERLFALYDVKASDCDALFDAMTDGGRRPRLVDGLAGAMRRADASNVAPECSALSRRVGGGLRLPFRALRPIAPGEELLWDRREVDPTGALR
ncbi:MAG: adenosylmethionine decarboxylase [Polyangiales bacterium]